MKPSRRTPRVKVTKFQGVYYREFPEKRHKGKADRIFDISYKDRYGKLKWEKVGWWSDGYSAVLASQVRAERIRSIRHGEEIPPKKEGPPPSLRSTRSTSVGQRPTRGVGKPTTNVTRSI